MKKNRNYIKTGIPGFMRYWENNLTGREKNAFERELQKDPFSSEAEDGLSSLSADEVRKDMDVLSKRLKSKTTGSRRFIIYRIAASVALLMAISTMFFLLRRTEEVKTLNQPETLEIAITEPIAAPKDDQEISGKSTLPAGPEKEKADNIKLRQAELIAVNTQKKSIADTVKEAVKFEAHEIKEADKVADVVLLPAAERSTAERKQNEAKGEGDTLKIASQVAEAVAIEEAAASGKREKKIADRSLAGGVSKTVLSNDEKISNYTTPEPVSGKENFDKYIQENIQRSVTTKEAVVVLSFIVRYTGIPDSIKVVKSPGQPFSDEAIRLLREGPRWKPATENGVPVEVEARIRIVFN